MASIRVQTRRGGRPRSLSRELIIAAALELVDAEGLDALTIRRLSERLGVGQMTLYGYFRTKDEIVDELGAQVLGELATAVQAEGRWDERLAEAFRGIRITLRQHPAAGAYLTASHGTHGPMLDHVRDTLIGVLLESGFEPQAAVDAIAVLTSYAVGFSEVETARAHRGPVEEHRQQLAALDPAEYPHLTSVAGPWVDSTGDRTFEVGLELIVDGLRRRLN